ncbi:hypothetical protein O7600_17510 [Micromonospora sp. WMMA1998]|uniref:hypothetical protein n=1 Tax=Micromonospora sp. WMMA1998 TaxID=3015167 RepID=UPI00248B78C6|nr:hypothetical protein [Micromonospora sp. WMMA1998]WBC12972.1 hypothetical protein O7600_17510 [Micromonospora sp. WMMA1998]
MTALTGGLDGVRRLIPETELDVIPDLPENAEYWMPGDDDIDDEGIGFFRGVWAILDVPRHVASAVVADEQAAAKALDALSPDEETFDRLARVLEEHNPDFPSEDPEDVPVLELLAQHMDLSSFSLEGLEVGVSGLSHVLGSIGCVPAASCRGHVGEHAWSDHPSVFVAIDRPHAEWLRPLVQRTSCGFAIDPWRENLLVIYARSIRQTMELAALILEEAQNLPPALAIRPRGSDSNREPEVIPEVDGQLSLFD